MKYLNSLLKILTHPENRNQAIKTVARILWWKVNQWYFKLPVIYRLTETTRIICDPESSYGSYIIYARFPEYEEMSFIHNYLQPTDIVIDVGANIGAVTLVAADKVHKGKIFSFEPTPAIYQKLERNIHINQLEKRVDIQNKAISNTNGFVNFVLERESEVNHIMGETPSKENSRVLKVPSITLDSFIKNSGISKVNLLKVDVEGAELQVFQGALDSLKKRRIEIIVFEVNTHLSNFGATPTQIFSLLKSYGYTVYQFSNNPQLTPITIKQPLTTTVNLVAVSCSPLVKKRIRKYLRKTQ